jgi:DUF1365 family protein
MWYLYTAEKVLDAVIIEVDSSFTERRMWLTRNVLPSKAKNGPYCFRGKFVKDLQISPFLPIRLDYTIDTCDPCASDGNRFDFLISARSEEGTLMVARASSNGSTLDVANATLPQKLLFMARWWWVPNAVTVTCRILFQAARIYLKAPRTWDRPEPTGTSIAKPARKMEM